MRNGPVLREAAGGYMKRAANSAGMHEPRTGALRLPLRHEMGERVRGEVARLKIRERGRARCATPLSSSLPAPASRGERAGARLAFAWRLPACGRAAYLPDHSRFASPT